MAIFQIKDGFCINTSGVDGQEIYSISTEITTANSNNTLVTESAVKNYVDEHGSGGSIPITTKGDMVIGDENGDAIRMPIGTSGQTLMVTSGGDLAYCDILTRSSVTWGDNIGTYTTSATNNNFLDIRGKYGYNTYDANTIKYSGVMMKLNWDEFRVNSNSVVIGAPFRPDWPGAFFRGVRKIGSYGANTKMMLIGESGGSAGMGGNFTSAYTSVGSVALAIATDSSNSSIIVGAYNNSNTATTAIADYNINNLLSYTGYGAKFNMYFSTNPGNVPEWSGASYNSKKSYVAIHATQTNGDGLLTVCSSATNQYGDTNAKCETVGFRVRGGWSAFDDKVTFNTNAYFRNGLYARKLIVGVADWSGGWGTRPSDGGIIYGYGETSARDAITSYGKDPGRQYYTTDDNRVNVYNNTTSGWDKVAYLSDVGGGMTNPMSDEWDIIVGGTSGEPNSLAKGISGQVLGIGTSGNIEWMNRPQKLDWNIPFQNITGNNAPGTSLSYWLRHIPQFEMTPEKMLIAFQKYSSNDQVIVAIYDYAGNQLWFGQKTLSGSTDLSLVEIDLTKVGDKETMEVGKPWFIGIQMDYADSTTTWRTCNTAFVCRSSSTFIISGVSIPSFPTTNVGWAPIVGIIGR